MKKNILIYPSGAENAIEIYNSIKHSVHINVFGATGKVDHSELIYDNPIVYLPYISENDFLDKLNEAIVEHKIDFVFPTHDTVANYLSDNARQIKCELLSSPALTNEICRYKSKTYDFFSDEYFCPKVFKDLTSIDRLPVILKPDVGQGANGVELIEDVEVLKTKFSSEVVLVEYLPGKEYTVDCFTNFKGELLFSGARERAEIKMGISFKSIVAEERVQNEVDRIASVINDKLELRGLWFFQLKMDVDGKLKLLEISTRTAGTMGFFRHQGVNLPLLTIMDAMGMEVSIQKYSGSTVLYRSTMNRYKYDFFYNAIYIDFDDTIIVNNKVNVEAMAFLYQARNNGKKIILITKHESDIDRTLTDFAISKTLFDQIVLLKPEENKSDYIIGSDSIFIDNWFKERQEVYDKLGIPVFDVDAISSLLMN